MSLNTVATDSLLRELSSRGYRMFKSEIVNPRQNERFAWKFEAAGACLLRRDYRGCLWEIEKALPPEFAGMTDLIAREGLR